MPDTRGKHVLARGDKRPSPVGTTLIVTLRMLDILAQFYILTSRPLSHLFPSAYPATGYNTIFEHSPFYYLHRNIGLSPFAASLFNAALASMFKQCFWALYLAGEYMTVEAAFSISIFNTLQNSLNDTLFSASGCNPTWSPVCLVIGDFLVGTGIFIEIWYEYQRKRFKEDSKNRGKVYMGGWLGVVRHPNYAGYTMWRTGMALAGGGWVWGAVLCALSIWDFSNRAIPHLESYGEKKYGEQWVKFTEKVPYRLCPGVW